MSAPAFLIDELVEHLATHRRAAVDNPDALVFVGPRGGILRRRFGERTFASAVARVGLDQSLTFHGLRHAAITTMVEIGVHPRVMQGRAGHATSKLTMELYAHVPESVDRRAAEAFDRHYRQDSDDGNGAMSDGQEKRPWPERTGMTQPRSSSQPNVLLLAGPNGAGKTTASRRVVPAGSVFLNADATAAQLAAEGHGPAGLDIAAGRVLLHEMRALAAAGESFCVETNPRWERVHRLRLGLACDGLPGPAGVHRPP